MWAGTRRLLLLTVASPVPLLSRRLTPAVKLGLTRYPYGTVPQLLDDCVACAVDALVEQAGGPAWDDDGYAALVRAVGDALVATTVDVVVAVEKIVAVAHETRALLASGGPHREAVDDMRSQLVRLVEPGFVCATGLHRLADIPRYLRGIQRRWEKLVNNPGRDQQWMAQVQAVQAEYDDLLASLPAARRDDVAVRELRWSIEELRISYFAQELRTPYPVSDVRLYRAMDGLR
jgi:ATP-dependent helicase HrpA